MFGRFTARVRQVVVVLAEQEARGIPPHARRLAETERNELGVEGWQLVVVRHVGAELELIFKRRCFPPDSLRAAG